MQSKRILWFFVPVLLVGCDRSAPVAERAKPAQSEERSSPDSASAIADTHAGKGAGNEQAGKSENVETEGKLTLDKLSFDVPEAWKRKPNSSNFVLAEYSLGKAEGDDADGRLTVSVAGGSVEANISRWRDQFGGKPETSSEDKKTIGDLEITIVDYSGEFNDQRGPFAPAAKRANYRMLAAVIPVNGELHFVKATGPQATIAAHADHFHAFVDSVKRK